MSLSIGARRVFWRIVLVYAIGSGAYASWMLLAGLFFSLGEVVPFSAIVLVAAHVCLYPIAWFSWNAMPGEGWEGLIESSENSRALTRRMIRVLGVGLAVAVSVLAFAVLRLDVGTSEVGRTILPEIGIAAFILFFSVLYGAYSLLGSAVIRSPTGSKLEKLAMKVRRRVLERRKSRR